MNTNMDYKEAAKMLVQYAAPAAAEEISLDECAGRVLAFELKAMWDVPQFDRSPYDGYAFRAKDSEAAGRDNPVTLKVLEEVPAGAVPTKTVIPGTAVKVLTGAPIPEGADAVVMYEKTSFDSETVTLYEAAKPGENIIYACEDVKKGSILAHKGCVIDPGTAGTLASQGIWRPLVYQKPLIGIISTGSELVDAGASQLSAGKIINTNRYSIGAALINDGCRTVYIGTAADDAQQIAQLISKGLKEKGCDMLILTGGVSAGDYDLTPEAMEIAGCSILARKVALKPGMACCYGEAGGKLVCALSGNPSSSLTNYYAVVRPAVRKLTGLPDYMPEMITVTLGEDFNKKSKVTRILKGRLHTGADGAVLHIPSEQGNVMISSSIGCGFMAEVPAGSQALKAGTLLQGFMV